MSWQETVKSKRVKAAVCKRSQGQGKANVPYPGRSAFFKEAEVSRGGSSRWSNDHPGRPGKPGYRAKGRTVEELSGKEKGNGEDSRNLAIPGQAWK